ncbi:MAG: hypothetical protein PXX82_08895, partial [Methanomassiliicoccales archaeon]|nr:hypothetical protein [Methanomassiliicoccales archaeon]
MNPMEPYVTEARHYITAKVSSLYKSEAKVELEIPAARADIAFPCFTLARAAGKAPQEIAAEI